MQNIYKWRRLFRLRYEKKLKQIITLKQWKYHSFLSFDLFPCNPRNICYPFHLSVKPQRLSVLITLKPNPCKYMLWQNDNFPKEITNVDRTRNSWCCVIMNVINGALRHDVDDPTFEHHCVSASGTQHAMPQCAKCYQLLFHYKRGLNLARFNLHRIRVQWEILKGTLLGFSERWKSCRH